MHAHDHLPLDDLQRIAKTITRKRVWVRYQAVILATQGRSAAAIAQALGCSGRAVQKWIARYNQGGPQALNERPHTGRRPRLPGRCCSTSRSGWRPGLSLRTGSVPCAVAISNTSWSTSSAC